MSDVDQRLRDFSPERRALLARLVEARKNAKTTSSAIQRRTSAGPCPTSYSQQLLWLSDQMVPERSTYNVSISLLVTGPLNIAAFERTMNIIVERHESLRATFHIRDGQLLQEIHPPKPFVFVHVDAAGLSDDEVRTLANQRSRLAFDLASDQLLRGTVYQIAPDRTFLLVSTHHITFDAWSRRNFYKEIERIYPACCNGTEADLPALPIQYPDFAVWQRERMEGPAMVQELDYWRKQLTGAPGVLDLPADYERPPVLSYRGARRHTTGLSALMEPLKALRESESVTHFTAMLAAFNVLLYRYTGQEDILVGTPVLGRWVPELEELIGLFMNTLVVRTDLSGDPTFRELMHRVQRVVLDAFDHQEMPYERLVTELQPQRDPSRNAFYQVLFGAGQMPVVPPRIPGLEFSTLKLDRGVSKLDLTFGVTAYDDQMMDGCEYSTDLFEPSTIDRILGHYQHLVASIVKDPDQRISQLDFLPEGERRQLLVEWNDTARPYPSASTIHQLIEEQAARTPDAPAVELNGERLSYAELNARANRLAHFLRGRGVGPNVPVGLACRRSLEMTVGLLGILKAGGACVPIDPEYPADHRAYLIEDSGLKVLLTQQKFASDIPPSQAEVVVLDRDWNQIADEAASNPPALATATDPAYVIYTSGTTGRPRGVLLSHRGLVNHHFAAIDLYHLKPQDRVLQFCSVSFDISIEEIFPTWISGGTVVLRPEELLIAGHEFVSWLERNRITVLDLPTAFWHSWVRDLAENKLSVPASVRLVIVGGEQPSSAALAEWRRIAGEIRWVNTYGPTEASVIVAAYEPAAEIPNRLPIGRPIANTQIYILDRNQQPVPVGVLGEVYLGGAGVALGYWNRPELTAEKFVRDPFSADPQARLYRTGDQARYRTNGEIEFAGRADRQIKVRGFRVEPQQVEAALQRHPDIREAFVMLREDRPGDPQLTGYIVPRQDAAADRTAVLLYLKDVVPQYMVPTFLVAVEQLPLTANGKVDWRALPVPDAAEAHSELVAPRTPIEEEVAVIWSEILRCDRVSVHDDFFSLGGDSLLAARLIARIQNTWDLQIGIRALFEAPTIAGLSEAVFQQLLQLDAAG